MRAVGSASPRLGRRGSDFLLGGGPRRHWARWEAESRAQASVPPLGGGARAERVRACVRVRARRRAELGSAVRTRRCGFLVRSIASGK